VPQVAVVAPRPATAGLDRLRRLMRQPHTLREAILLRELLDRPLALRRRR